MVISADAKFGDEDAFADFLGQHEVSHQGIAQKLIAAGQLIAMIPMADTPVNHSDWLLDHYQIHREIARVLNTILPDLASVDLQDENQYIEWMRLHGAVHAQINLALGIST